MGLPRRAGIFGGDDRLAAQQLCIVVDRTRPSDQIALQAVAEFCGQEGALVLGLNPFGDDRKVEPPALSR